MKYVELNENQKAAARHGDGPMMVLAGPGSGKTTVIIYRVAYMLRKLLIDPSSVLVITFTKAATLEMHRRFLEISGEGGEAVVFSTFHSLFFRVIKRRYNYTAEMIIKDEIRRDLIKNILAARRLETEDEFLQGVLNELSRQKNDLIELRHFNSMHLSAEDFKTVREEYENYKTENNKIDFDDMCVKCFELFKNEPKTLEYWRERFRYILVDEFQDINKVQYLTVLRLAGANGNIFVVGDDDQSIYRFRGARPEFLQRFPKDYKDTGKVVLDTNYRSTEQIINLCNTVIMKNRSRFEKVIRGTGKAGQEPRLIKCKDVNSEAALIASYIKKRLRSGGDPSEFAVIYRTNTQSRAVIDAFMNANIPFQVKDESPGIYEHWITRDIYAYMLAAETRQTEAIARIINKPNRYVGGAAAAAAKKAGGDFIKNLYRQKLMQPWQYARIEELQFYLKAIGARGATDSLKYIRQAVGYDDYIRDYAAYRKMNPSGLFEVLDELQEASMEFKLNSDFMAHVDEVVARAKEKRPKDANPGENPAAVLFTTMHSAKGLEFETVFVISAVEGSIPHERSRTVPEIEEERRLFYVGLTRAKTRLFVSAPENRREQAVELTRFLDGSILGKKSVVK